MVSRTKLTLVANQLGSDFAVGLNRTERVREFELEVHRFEAGRHPSALAVADLDGDGLLDIVTAARGDDELVVLTATGVSPPRFAAPIRLATADQPSGVELADVNGDGRPDLLSISRSKAELSVFLNQSTPGALAVSERFVFDGPEAPVALDVADFDGGGPDVAVTGFAGDLAIYENATAIGDSVPAFERQLDRATGNDPVAAAAADFDGDGRLDLAVANRGDATLWIALNDSAPGTIELNASGVFDLPYETNAILPFEQGGGIDVVVAGERGITLMRSRALLAFESLSVQLGVGTRAVGGSSSFAAAIARGDLDGDGIDELVYGLASSFGGGAILVAFDRPVQTARL